MQSFIGEIGIFMICAQAILHFRPKESYGKYLRLLFSVMILVQIFQPVSELFLGGRGVELQKSVREFQDRLDESMEQAAKTAAGTEARLQQMSMEELQKRQEVKEEQVMEGEKQIETDGKTDTQEIQIEVEEIRITWEEE